MYACLQKHANKKMFSTHIYLSSIHIRHTFRSRPSSDLFMPPMKKGAAHQDSALQTNVLPPSYPSVPVRSKPLMGKTPSTGRMLFSASDAVETSLRASSSVCK